MSLLIGDQREGLAFAASAGGGWDGDERQHWLGGFAGAPVILHAPAVGEEKIATLGGVHAAAAAQADDGVDARGFGNDEAIIDVAGRGIFARLAEEGDLEFRGFEAWDARAVK